MKLACHLDEPQPGSTRPHNVLIDAVTMVISRTQIIVSGARAPSNHYAIYK